MKTNFRRWLFLLLFAVLQAVLLSSAYLIGNSQPSLLPGQQQYALFNEAKKLLDQNFIGEPPTAAQIEYGMIKGLVHEYKDPYTVFVEPPQAELQTDLLAGKYGGIGVRLERDTAGQLRLYPFVDSPASKAGLQDGDILLYIGDYQVNSQDSLDVVETKLRGLVGDPVDLQIKTVSNDSVMIITILREEIAVPSTTWNQLPENSEIGVIHVSVISAPTVDEIQSAWQKLSAAGATKLILDLRNNGGGLVDSGIKVSTLFLDRGNLLEQQFKGRPVESYAVSQPGPLRTIPLVVLVNKNTASAAEMVAGSIQARKRANIVGSNTYGKDSIQNVFGLSDGSSIHITSAHWWIPGIPLFGGSGLIPDIRLPDDAQDAQYLSQAVMILSP